jgi:hypothetical protein
MADEDREIAIAPVQIWVDGALITAEATRILNGAVRIRPDVRADMQLILRDRRILEPYEFYRDVSARGGNCWTLNLYSGTRSQEFLATCSQLKQEFGVERAKDRPIA